MSREIKFRAWLPSVKQMVPPGIFAIGFTGNIWEWRFSDGLFDAPDELIPMQYTGLEDKNGKEIYEGDVVMPHSKDAPYAKARAVEFSPDRGWGLPKKEQYTEPTNGCVWWAQFEYDVIGNIYENPELLEAANV